MKSYRLPSSLQDAERLQLELAKKVVVYDDFEEIELVCGVDVSYREGMAKCAAVVLDNQLNLSEYATTKSVPTHPYIPGFFMLREAGPALCTLEKLKSYDLLFVDGHGQLHPRKFGFACYLGVMLNKPTIGVAKSILCGVEKNGQVELEGKVVGAVITGKKKLYVSVGHRISLTSAQTFVRNTTRKGEWLPEPLRMADAYSKL